MVKCSIKTKPDNTICVKENETETCPITFFAITASRENLEKAKEKEAKAKVIRYLKIDNKQYYIVINKQSDNLPIMKTALEVGLPCMNSS